MNQPRRVLGVVLAAGTVLSLSMGLSGCAKKETASEPAAPPAEQAAPVAAATAPAVPASSVPAATPANTVVAFSDLADVETKGLIEELHQLNVFEGMGPEFKPYEPITRGEYITWLFKAYNAIRPAGDKIRKAPQLPPQFKDLPATHPAYPYAQALANAGYSVGYDDGTFKPDQPLTREELVAIKVGVDKGKSMKPEGLADLNATWSFSDAPAIDKRYTGYVYADYFAYNPSSTSGQSRSNIIRSFGKIGTFRPKSAVLRHEAAASLWQVDEYAHATATIALERLAHPEGQ